MNDLAQTMREIQVEILPMHPGFGTSKVYLHLNGARGREQLLERLNDSDRFLPLKGGDGKMRLHAKAGIAALNCREVPDEVRELMELLPSTVPVRIRLRDGSELEGNLVFVLPGARHRVLDFLNTPEHFFLLATKSGATFVNKDWVDFALPQMETP